VEIYVFYFSSLFYKKLNVLTFQNFILRFGNINNIYSVTNYIISPQFGYINKIWIFFLPQVRVCDNIVLYNKSYKSGVSYDTKQSCKYFYKIFNILS